MRSKSVQSRGSLTLARWLGARPSRWLVASVSLWFLNYMFGPYDYSTNGGILGWLYLFVAFIIFWLGLFIGEHLKPAPMLIEYGKSRLGKSYELMLLPLLCLFLAASIYNYSLYSEIAGGGVGLASGEARNALDSLAIQGYERSILARISDGMATASLAFPLLVLSCRTRYFTTVLLAIFPSIVMLLTQFSIGGRNAAALVVMVLGICFILRRNAGLHEHAGMIWLQKILIIGVAASLLIMVMMFAWRYGVGSQSELDVSSPFVWNGVSVLRDSYRAVNDGCDGCLSSVYLLSYYASHSAPFFVSLFEASDYSSPEYGAFHFRIFGLIYGGGGQFIKIIESQPFFGLYPTALQGLLLDFGLFGALCAVLITGFLFGAVANAAIRGNPYACCFVPLILGVVAISPVYYFIWGGADFVFLGLAVLIGTLGLMGFLTGRRVFEN